MQREIENFKFVQSVNIEFIGSLENNGTKYFLKFEESSEKICNSKARVDFATAGRHRGLSIIYIKHNLFHQSKHGRDVELQNTHIVLFKSPREVMHVSTLCAQLGLGSELVDWHWDATYVPYGHFLIDLWPRTNDRLRYCTNTGSISSIFFYPGPVETVKIFGRWTHKICFLSTCFNHFPTNAKVFSFSLAQDSLSGFFANA